MSNFGNFDDCEEELYELVDESSCVDIDSVVDVESQ